MNEWHYTSPLVFKCGEEDEGAEEGESDQYFSFESFSMDTLSFKVTDMRHFCCCCYCEGSHLSPLTLSERARRNAETSKSNDTVYISLEIFH